jgi:hypothetical protein
MEIWYIIIENNPDRPKTSTKMTETEMKYQYSHLFNDLLLEMDIKRIVVETERLGTLEIIRERDGEIKDETDK